MFPDNTPPSVKSHHSLKTGDSIFEDFFKLTKRAPSQPDEKEVWLAENAEKKNVELHFLADSVLKDAGSIPLYEEIIQSARELKHPNLLKVASFHTDGKKAAICLESYDGFRLEELTQSLGSLIPNKSMSLVEGICKGLSYLHEEQSLVHWDLTPAAIRIGADHGVKIAPPEYWSAHGTLEDGSLQQKNLYAAENKINSGEASWVDDLQSLALCLCYAFSGKAPIAHPNHADSTDSLKEEHPHLAAFLRRVLEKSSPPTLTTAQEFLRSYKEAHAKDLSSPVIKAATPVKKEKVEVPALDDEIEQAVKLTDPVKTKPEAEAKLTELKPSKAAHKPSVETQPKSDSEKPSIFHPPAQSEKKEPREKIAPLKKNEASATSNTGSGRFFNKCLPLLLLSLIALSALVFFVSKSCRNSESAMASVHPNENAPNTTSNSPVEATEKKTDLTALPRSIPEPAPEPEIASEIEVVDINQMPPVERLSTPTEQTFSWNGLEVPMLWIAHDSDSSDSEQAPGYWISERAVSQEQWHIVTGENAPADHQLSTPIASVSWQDTKKFLALLNEQKSEKGQYDLPSQDEWKKAFASSAPLKASLKADRKVVWEWCRDDLTVKGISSGLRGFIGQPGSAGTIRFEQNLPTHKRPDLGFRLIYRK